MGFIVEYFLEFSFGILISIISYLIKQVLTYKKILNATKNGVVELLKLHIIDLYYEITIKNYITIREKEHIDILYKEYHKLDCCGVVEDIMKQLNDMKIK